MGTCKWFFHRLDIKRAEIQNGLYCPDSESLLDLCYTIIIYKLLMADFLGYDGIDTSDGGNVYNVTYGAFDVCEMNRFIQSHLYRADNFRFTHVLDELVSSIGRAQVREYPLF